MTDKELLEFAAKAIGLDVRPAPAWADGEWSGLIVFLDGNLSYTNWNPLEDDGHALGLGVKLALNLQHHDAGLPSGYVVVWHGRNHGIMEKYGKDGHAAIRRAIVRAAAAIGQSMKPKTD